MIKAELIRMLKKVPADAEIWALDGEVAEYRPVTGMVYSTTDGRTFVELQTDDPE